MKIVVLAACLFGLAIASQTTAQDRPFTGFYGQVRLSGAYGDLSSELERGSFRLPLSATTILGGLAGGGVGYDLPVTTNLRVGLQWLSSFGKISGDDRLGTAQIGIRSRYEIDQLHALRIRAGYVLDDRFLPYVAVGVAAGHGSIEGDGYALTLPPYTESTSGWAIGPTAAVGIEYERGRWRIGAEVAHSRFSGIFDECIASACADIGLQVNPTMLSLTASYNF